MSGLRAAAASFEASGPEQIRCVERAPSERFRLEVRLMAEPCLWCWEIRDTVHGNVVNSSYTDEWMAYDSSEEALTAANSRLRELDRSVRAGKVTRKEGASPR